MPPLLETERLRLRVATMDDLECVYQLGTNPNVMRYINGGQAPLWTDVQSDLLRRVGTEPEPLGYWITEEKESGDFVGWMTLKPLVHTKDVEIGYRFREEQWGKGFATEGGKRILTYAFQELELHRVLAVAMEENLASIRVMQKLGMKYLHRGRYYGRTCVCYATTRKVFLNKEKLF